MKIVICLMIAYLLGTLNPAALLSKRKHKDLRQCGTKNLGATNTLLVFGKRYAVFVMLFDISKAILAFKLGEWIEPSQRALAMAAGFAAVVGHCFPFYLQWKGGKGLAAFGGMVFACNPLFFVFLLLTGLILMIIVNYSFILPFYAAVAFPIYAAVHEEGMLSFLLALAASGLIFGMHFGNFLKAIRREDLKIRDFFKHGDAAYQNQDPEE